MHRLVSPNLHINYHTSPPLSRAFFNFSIFQFSFPRSPIAPAVLCTCTIARTNECRSVPGSRFLRFVPAAGFNRQFGLKPSFSPSSGQKVRTAFHVRCRCLPPWPEPCLLAFPVRRTRWNAASFFVFLPCIALNLTIPGPFVWSARPVPPPQSAANAPSNAQRERTHGPLPLLSYSIMRRCPGR